MASVWRRGRYWYGTFEDRTGRRVTRSTHITNFRDAQQLIEHLEAKEILAKRTSPTAAEERLAAAESTPLAALLDQWHDDIKARGNTKRHGTNQHFQAKDLLRRSQVASLSAILPAAVNGGLSKLRADKLSLNTLNHYVRAVKSFSRWLWKNGWIQTDQLIGVKGFHAATDPRRVRRALTLDEIRRLYKSADEGVPILGMGGVERGMMYRLMLHTGFRVGEVKSLRVRNFLPQQKPPILIVEAGYSKHRRQDQQPIRPEFARMLEKWLKKSGKTPDDLIFKIPDKPNRLLKIDAAAAVPPIPLVDDRGRVVDVHSLRHTFITECVKHFPPKIAQQLARHASITLTMDLYAHLETKAASDLLNASKFYGAKKKRR